MPAEQHRLRRLSERLHAKADQYVRLIGDRDHHTLATEPDALRGEMRHVSDRRSHLNDALA
ncbi:hypothetical protein ACFV7R_34475 [Streptomyces sp. NPDC059866]|uniref:hypothetical protein n=1 Tax=Streptomyces sp. NPDC059866 TaxID=3346978 RepID=UPI003648A64F